jgi:hypothetical protein
MSKEKSININIRSLIEKVEITDIKNQASLEEFKKLIESELLRVLNGASDNTIKEVFAEVSDVNFDSKKPETIIEAIRLLSQVLKEGEEIKGVIACAKLTTF